MKKVIIALTTAAVLCGASASFAQPQRGDVEASKVAGKRMVVIKVQGMGAVAAKPQLVTINGATITIPAGRSEASKTIALPVLLREADGRGLRLTHDGRVCPVTQVTFRPGPSTTATIILLLKPPRSTPTSGATLGKIAECQAHVEATRPRRS